MNRLVLVAALWVSGAQAQEAEYPLDEVEARGQIVVEPAHSPKAAAVVLSGGTVMTAAGQVHTPGYVVLTGGTIEAVGAGDAPVVEGAKVIDVTGLFVTPGLIDTHSHLGVYPSPSGKAHADGNEATAPTTPGVWAEHSVWPQDPGFQRAMAGGVTTLQILPGSANLIGGRGVVVRNVPARGSRAMRFPGAPETIKMACGENPKRVYGGKGGAPSTRMGNLRGQRAAYAEAQEYARKWERWHEGHARQAERYERQMAKAAKKGVDSKSEPPKHPDDPPARDLDLETLVGVLEGRVLPQIHCYRADDMLSMLQLSKEFGFQIRSFHHALEAYKIRDVLAAEGVASSTWADWWGFKLEAYDGIPTNAALLAESGARVIIHSDSAVGIQRLNQEAAKALASGVGAGIELSDDAVLQWITLNPAWALGVDDQVGSLEPGKRADVVVWTQHPFSVYSQARWVFVDGNLHYDKDRPRTWSDFEVGQEVSP